ncbi:MAG TPA: hypothetical protein VHF22_02250 [Planctomycetota bacterium]|nr:hypothetical protein [Planctomycetota bacterium]
MATSATVEIHTPLRLGEVLTAAITLYGRRPWAYVAVGLLQAGALLLSAVTPIAGDLAILSLAFVVSFAAVVRLVTGDPAADAARRALAALPVLVPLAFLVALPFTLASSWIILWLVAIVWLAFTGFAVPAAMVDEGASSSWVERLNAAVRRSTALARVEFLHALGVAAALFAINIVVGVLLAVALANFADNGQLAAVAIAQVVLSPFFFLGLTVLYFEQLARAHDKEG